jgi:hypothetical protein
MILKKLEDEECIPNIETPQYEAIEGGHRTVVCKELGFEDTKWTAFIVKVSYFLT